MGLGDATHTAKTGPSHTHRAILRRVVGIRVVDCIVFFFGSPLCIGFFSGMLNFFLHGMRTFHCACRPPHTVRQQSASWISMLTVHDPKTSTRSFFLVVVTISLMP